MSDQPVRITLDDTDAASEDRFHRFRLIGWWDQELLARAKVLVVGAGALGNEIIKNLSLLGVGNILIADMDRIENSNLSRSVLFRPADNGLFKAETAARTAKEIFPGIRVHHFNGDVLYDLGLGAYRWADLVLGGLDNRESRLTINRNCWKVGRPWIDGAIEQIQGVARVFVPDGACYECTMSQMDWQLLQKRRSCNLLSREEMEGGKTPTTPTASSIIAGVQGQEAVKLLHGLPTISGRGWVFDGMSTDGYVVEYQRKEDCYSHDMLDEVVPLDKSTRSTTVADLLQHARHLLGPKVEIEFAREILERLVCPNCRAEEQLFTSLGRARTGQAFCPECRTVRREVVTFYKVHGTESFLFRTLAEIGIPAYDIAFARSPTRFVGFEFSGDAEVVLGPLVIDEQETSHGRA